MLRRLALEPAFTVDRRVEGRLRPLFASDDYRACVQAFEEAEVDRGEIVLRCGIRILRSRSG